MRAEGKHATVSCEVCHAPLGEFANHGEVMEEARQMPVDRSFKLCGRCHQRLVARPATFPQVVLEDHVAERGADMTSEGVCLDCHDAHNPSE